MRITKFNHSVENSCTPNGIVKGPVLKNILQVVGPAHDYRSGGLENRELEWEGYAHCVSSLFFVLMLRLN